MVDQKATNLFNDIYDSTNRKVLNFITAKCNNTCDINDIFQETYMELYSVIVKRSPQYIENKEAFVMKIAKQKIYRHYTMFDKLKAIVSLFVTNNNGDEVNIVELETSDFSLEETVSKDALVSEINKVLSEKSQEVQKIFHLYYYSDMSIKEIAKLLSVTESHVKNKLYRTIKELRKLYIGKDGMNHE